MYAHNVHRDDYQDLGREMLGLPSIVQLHEAGRARLCRARRGDGDRVRPERASSPGHDQAAGQATSSREPHITDADKAAIDVRNGGKYVVAETMPGVNGAERAPKCRRPQAAREGHRLFGFYGKKGFNHLPYRTADGRYDPVAGIAGEPSILAPGDRPSGQTEKYTADDLVARPPN